jgi:hypothetical protein
MISDKEPVAEMDVPLYGIYAEVGLRVMRPLRAVAR